MGAPATTAPVSKVQIFSPVRASSAKALPSTSPAKIKSPAVARSEEALPQVVLKVHCFLPVRGSKAEMCGGAVLLGSSLWVPANQPSPSFTSSIFFFSTFRWEQISSAVVYHRPVRGLYAE